VITYFALNAPTKPLACLSIICELTESKVNLNILTTNHYGRFSHLHSESRL